MFCDYECHCYSNVAQNLSIFPFFHFQYQIFACKEVLISSYSIMKSRAGCETMMSSRNINVLFTFWILIETSRKVTIHGIFGISFEFRVFSFQFSCWSVFTGAPYIYRYTYTTLRYTYTHMVKPGVWRVRKKCF